MFLVLTFQVCALESGILSSSWSQFSEELAGLVEGKAKDAF